MLPDRRGYLWHIRDAAAAIIKFTRGIDEATFISNDLVHSAVERKFEIIGEALKLLGQVDPELAAKFPDRLKIIAFRNLLAHGYAVVEHDRVWEVSQNELLVLQKVVVELLDEFDAQ